MTDKRIVLEGFDDLDTARGVVEILTDGGVKRDVIEIA